MKKICFAISVHEKKEVIKDLLDNIEFFCPNSSIVFFQSGNDPNLCDDLGYLVCPASEPLSYSDGIIWFHFHVMEWLEAINFDYDYLTILDSDALFAKKGFEEFITTEMNGFDYMAVEKRFPAPHWYPGIVMRQVWDTWQPLFQIPYFLACFNVGQTFSKKFVQEIIAYPQLAKMKQLIRETETCMIEEILFVTLADTLGVTSKSYSYGVQEWIRFRPHFSEGEIKYGVNKDLPCYLIHPIHRNLEDPVRKFIRTQMK